MKRSILVLALALLASVAGAQSPQIDGVLTSANCPGTGCLTLSVQGMGAASIEVRGTYSGTVQFEVTNGGVTYSALSLTPSTSGSAVTFTTSTGVWTGWVGGNSIVRARMSSYTSGTARITIGGALGLAAPGLAGVVVGNGVTAATAIPFPNDATKYLNGTGAFTVPAGGGGRPEPRQSRQLHLFGLEAVGWQAAPQVRAGLTPGRAAQGMT